MKALRLSVKGPSFLLMSSHFNYALSLSPDSVLGIVGMAGLCLTVYIILTSIIPWGDRAEA